LKEKKEEINNKLTQTSRKADQKAKLDSIRYIICEKKEGEMRRV